MDHSIPRPIGLAALITATVTLFSTGAMEQAGQTGKAGAIAQQSTNGITLSSNVFSPSVVTALQGNAVPSAQKPALSRSNPLRRSQQIVQNQQTFNKKQLQGQERHPELQKGPQKDLPEDIRTARLMLSVESLLKSTTPN